MYDGEHKRSSLVNDERATVDKIMENKCFT